MRDLCVGILYPPFIESRGYKMYFIRNGITQQPIYPMFKGRVQRAYALKVVAEVQAEKVEKTHTPLRVDVVEISRSARLWLENQARINSLYLEANNIQKEGVPNV